VLHVAPESAAGGPLALVCDRDLVELDVAARKLALHVSEDEPEKRRADWQPPAPKYGRSYGALYLRHITQANEGCGFDFLAAGPPTPNRRSTDKCSER
jgi:dihydroxy-acid dehydratase